MASLEEIRKRFAKVNSGEEGNWAVGGGNGASSAAASALSSAALKIFDPMKKFEVQVSEITKIAEPLERVLNQTARTLEEIRVFSGEMERLAKAYDGIRTFQAALNADAARELRQQFDGIEKTFYENLSTASALLDPAREFQARIGELAKIFDGLKPLQDKFNALAKNFKPQPPIDTAAKGAIVLDQPASPSATVSIVTPNAAVSSNGH
jgi:flagellin-specific chaperone FliS